MSWHDLSGFQRDLLQASATLARHDETPYGLAIKAWLDERYADPVNHSRCYQNLDTLVERGLLRREAVDDRTNRYELTPAGQQCLREQAAALSAVSGLAADGGDRR